MTYVLILSVVAFAIAFSDAEQGLIAMLVVGFAQDPLRKMLPGEPLYLTLAAAGVGGAVFLGLLTRQPVSLEPIVDRYSRLRTPLYLYCGLILIQVARAYFNTGSIMVPAIGLIAYFVPLAMLVVVFYTTDRLEQVYTFFAAYVILATIPLIGVYLSYLGVNHPILQPVGPGLHAFSRETESGILTLHQGLFRGSELAGWHAAAAACLSVAVVMRQKTHPSLRVALTALIPVLLMACVFTGRRKFLVLFGLFLVFATLYGLRRPVIIEVLTVTVGVAVAAFGFFTVTVDAEKLKGATPYLSRLAQIVEEAPDRFAGVGIRDLKYVYYRNGILGAGAGAGSQGAQHYGAGSKITGAAAEGGLGKVLAELGVVGLIVVGLLLLALVRTLREVHGRMNEDENVMQHAQVFVMVAAFLTANFVTFIIGHQIFGDPFVIVLLGLAAGLLLVIPQLIVEEDDVVLV